MNSAQEVLQGKDTAIEPALYMSFELADKTWKLTFGDMRRTPCRFTVAAGDQAAVLCCIAKARLRRALAPQAPVYSCYEAGRDGWWLHRWLKGQGIGNIVVDSSSIQVDRRARRAKSDRLDGDKLLAMLQRYCAGERRIWSVVHEPTAEQEDQRRTSRELWRLTKERTAHTNRIRSLLVLHNLRPGRMDTRAWIAWWSGHCETLPPKLRAELEREIARLALVDEQLKTIETQQRKAVATKEQPSIAHLATLRGIGVRSAWALTTELFGWRRFANRRELGACLGLTPTPYSSGESCTEQGISKAGNKRLRTVLVELAWRWLRLQPDSELSSWFNQRFVSGSKRMRRVGIVALARRLAVALWRFVDHGEIPAGAALKPQTAA